jgi:hypothetical protein
MTESRIGRIVSRAWRTLLSSSGRSPKKVDVATFKRWSRVLAANGIQEISMSLDADDVEAFQAFIVAMNSDQPVIAIPAPWHGAEEASAWLLVPRSLRTIAL